MAKREKSVGKVITAEELERALLTLRQQHQQQVQQANATAGAITLVEQQLASLKE